MHDDRKRHPREAPIETEGMGGAGGGDIDDVGDVGYPRDTVGPDVTRGRGIPEGMGGAGGGDIDDVGDVGNPDHLEPSATPLDGPDDDVDMLPETTTGGSAGRPVARGETGTVTGITTGVDTDDATEGPGSPWDHVDDEPPLSDERDSGLTS